MNFSSKSSCFPLGKLYTKKEVGRKIKSFLNFIPEMFATESQEKMVREETGAVGSTDYKYFL